MGDVSGSAGIRTLLVLLALVGGAAVATRLLRSRRVVVRGLSMAPTLLPGDRLVVIPAGKPRLGDLITVPDPRQPERLLVKRVVSIDPSSSTVMVAGDNVDASTGSATFGPVPWRTVLGRVTYCYFPRERAGRIRPRGDLRGAPGCPA